MAERDNAPVELASFRRRVEQLLIEEGEAGVVAGRVDDRIEILAAAVVELH